MFFSILIALISLSGLLILHEFGHFILAKKFGIKVEEFGIFLPPRLIGKKIGETIYSLNLLPFGAFVKIYGEEKREQDYRSFSKRPIWQRALVVLGGVVSFWIISAILLSIVMGLGIPTTIEDEQNHNLINPKVQIVAIAPDSPAANAGLEVGDAIIKLQITNYKLQITKVKEVQEFTNSNKGKEITLTIQRGKEVFDVTLVPRILPPKEEGPMGVALARTALLSYPWYQAPIRGALATFNLTLSVITGWIEALKNLFLGLPTETQLMGPVGIFDLFTKVSQLGISYFIQFVAVISIYLALFNILPIPAVDGGKLLFLGIEAVRRKPISQEIEQKITAFFFSLLILLMFWITIKDITRIF